MLLNYLTVALRSLLKNKVFSAINIFGLSIGLAACLLIFQFVSFELSYDRFNSKADRTYRITNDRFQNGKLIQHGTIMYPTIGPTMAKDYPEIEEYTRLMPGNDLNIKVEDRLFKGGESYFADERFLKVFDFPMLAGDRATCLLDKFSIVITEETAIRYFGVADKNYSAVLGRPMYWSDDPQPLKVTAVCANVPENSHIQFDALISYNTLISANDQSADNSWTWSDMRHYLVLKPGVDYKELESKFPAFSDRYFQGDKVSGSVEKFYLQPLNRAHLYSDYEYDIAKKASGKAVWAMAVVAMFILLIAWINYINLTTSRAIERAKEVGLRKVMGAAKGQLVYQFILESVLVSGVAFALALLMVGLVQSWFNNLVSSTLSWKNILALLDLKTAFMAGLLLLTGVLAAGFYPAFVLSAYQPVTVLKGKFVRSGSGNLLRKLLVVFQFTAAGALITGTLIVSGQLKFMNELDLGINLRNKLVVEAPERTGWDSTFIQRVETYKHAIHQIRGVESATTSGRLPGNRLGRYFNIRLQGQASDVHYTMSAQNVDYNFIDTYGVKLIAGRKFEFTDHKFKWNDINTVILNMSAIRLLGLDSASNAIGRVLVDGQRKWTIVGVVNDYHQESLRNPMEAMVFRPSYSTYAPTTIRINNESAMNPQPVIAEIEKVYKEFFPGNAFVYFSMEDRYKQQYNDDNRFGEVISVFTGLAIIISCLGLVGLSSYMATQRTREIGIRKVLGASLSGIVALLSFDFLRLVLWAVLMALPISYVAMSDWLKGYAYHFSPGIWSYLFPGVLMMAIAAFTMSFQVVRSALINPAETLKCE